MPRGNTLLLDGIHTIRILGCSNWYTNTIHSPVDAPSPSRYCLGSVTVSGHACLVARPCRIVCPNNCLTMVCFVSPSPPFTAVSIQWTGLLDLYFLQNLLSLHIIGAADCHTTWCIHTVHWLCCFSVTFYICTVHAKLFSNSSVLFRSAEYHFNNTLKLLKYIAGHPVAGLLLLYDVNAYCIYRLPRTQLNSSLNKQKHA